MERTAAALGTIVSETRRSAAAGSPENAEMHDSARDLDEKITRDTGNSTEASVRRLCTAGRVRDGGKRLGGETQLRRGITHCTER